MTSDELKAYVEEVAAQCVSKIGEHWEFSPNMTLSGHLANSPIRELELHKYHWQTTLKYYIAKAAAEAVLNLKK